MQGRQLDEDQIAGVRVKLKDEDWRNAVKERADVKAEIARITVERAQARLAKAQEKAAAADTEGLGELLA